MTLSMHCRSQCGVFHYSIWILLRFYRNLVWYSGHVFSFQLQAVSLRGLLSRACYMIPKIMSGPESTAHEDRPSHLILVLFNFSLLLMYFMYIFILFYLWCYAIWDEFVGVYFTCSSYLNIKLLVTGELYLQSYLHHVRLRWMSASHQLAYTKI